MLTVFGSCKKSPEGSHSQSVHALNRLGTAERSENNTVRGQTIRNGAFLARGEMIPYSEAILVARTPEESLRKRQSWQANLGTHDLAPSRVEFLIWSLPFRARVSKAYCFFSLTD